jgi:hypothetical protein
MFEELKPILKALLPLFTAVAGTVFAAITDNQITVDEWKLIAGAFLTAVGVYLVPNKPANGGGSPSEPVEKVGSGPTYSA